MLGVPVVGTIARKKKTLENLMQTLSNVCNQTISFIPESIDYTGNDEEYLENIFKKAHNISNEVCKIEKNRL